MKKRYYEPEFAVFGEEHEILMVSGLENDSWVDGETGDYGGDYKW